MSGYDHLRRNKLKIMQLNFYKTKLNIIKESLNYIDVILNQLPKLSEFDNDNIKIINKVIENDME